jgi:hypothetical protein
MRNSSCCFGFPASAFFDDPAAWGSVKMQTWGMRGDKAKALAYADSARVAFESQLKVAPDDPQLHVLHGLALAYMGRKAEAVAEGERSLALMPISKDANNGAYDQHQLVRFISRWASRRRPWISSSRCSR